MKKTDSLQGFMYVFLGIVIILIGSIVFILIRINRIESMLGLAGQPAQVLGLEDGKLAPSFTVNTIDGKTFASSDLFSQPTMLIFSSTTCPHCQYLYPYLKEFSDKNPTHNIFMFSLGTKEEINQMISDNGFRFVEAEWKEEISTQYIVPGTPFVYLIDKGGKILNSGVPATFEDLQQLAKPRTSE